MVLNEKVHVLVFINYCCLTSLYQHTSYYIVLNTEILHA